MKKNKMKKKLVLNKMSIALLDNEEKSKIKRGGVGNIKNMMEAGAPGSRVCKTDYAPLCPQSAASIVMHC